MGLLTILKKMKQKERELRLLMLYPPRCQSREGSRGPPPGGRCQAPPTGCGMCGRPIPTALCASRTWALPKLLAGGREEAVPPARAGGGPGGFVPKAKGVGVKEQRPDQMSQCRRRWGPEVTRTLPPVGLARAWGRCPHRPWAPPLPVGGCQASAPPSRSESQGRVGPALHSREMGVWSPRVVQPMGPTVRLFPASRPVGVPAADGLQARGPR